jgi:amphi-Trp domain-containing protein
MPKRPERDIEKGYPRKEFAAKLRRLADAIEAGDAFSIQVAGERLHIPSDALFNIEHEREGNVDELEFQLRWKRESNEAILAPMATRAKTAKKASAKKSPARILLPSGATGDEGTKPKPRKGRG